MPQATQQVRGGARLEACSLTLGLGHFVYVQIKDAQRKCPEKMQTE